MWEQQLLVAAHLCVRHNPIWFSAHAFLHPYPPRSTEDAEIKALPVGAQGYEKFQLSKPVVGQNIALHAVPADRANYLVSALPIDSTSFPPNLPDLQQWNVS